MTDWVIDGLGRSINHTTSYTAICATLPLLASTDAKPVNGNAFDYIVLNADGSVDQTSSDTYKLRTK